MVLSAHPWGLEDSLLHLVVLLQVFQLSRQSFDEFVFHVNFVQYRLYYLFLHFLQIFLRLRHFSLHAFHLTLVLFVGVLLDCLKLLNA